MQGPKFSSPSLTMLMSLHDYMRSGPITEWAYYWPGLLLTQSTHTWPIKNQNQYKKTKCISYFVLCLLFHPYCLIIAVDCSILINIYEHNQYNVNFIQIAQIISWWCAHMHEPSHNTIIIFDYPTLIKVKI